LRGKLVHFSLNPLQSSRDPLVTKSALRKKRWSDRHLSVVRSLHIAVLRAGTMRKIDKRSFLVAIEAKESNV
jgi:hypothetical protein